MGGSRFSASLMAMATMFGCESSPGVGPPLVAETAIEACHLECEVRGQTECFNDFQLSLCKVRCDQAVPEGCRGDIALDHYNCQANLDWSCTDQGAPAADEPMACEDVSRPFLACVGIPFPSGFACEQDADCDSGRCTAGGACT